MLIKEALEWGHQQLISSSSARLDAEVLLSHVLGKPVTFLLAHNEQEIGWWSLWRFHRVIARRREGIPVAYLTGHKEFFMMDFRVSPAVLVPRPDTEILVESVIEYIRELDKNPLLVDVGTGSACIPISVLKNIDGMRAIATEISRSALRVARKNIRKHQMVSRIQLIHSDLLEKLPKLKGKDLVVTANLPYIPTDFQVNPEIAFEPDISLYGGEDGLDIYKCLMQQLAKLKPRAIFLELFDFQIALLAKDMPGYRLKIVKNMSGQARLMILERL